MPPNLVQIGSGCLTVHALRGNEHITYAVFRGWLVHWGGVWYCAELRLVGKDWKH